MRIGTPEAARNWRMLADLLLSGGSLYLSATTDEGTGDATVSVVQTRPDGKRRSAARGDLDEAVAALAGAVGEKMCRTCKESRPLDQFSRLASGSEDGRNAYCRFCERERVRKYGAKKRAGQPGKAQR